MTTCITYFYEVEGCDLTQFCSQRKSHAELWYRKQAERAALGEPRAEVQPGEGGSQEMAVRVRVHEGARVRVRGGLALRSVGPWECVLGPPGGKKSARFSWWLVVLQLLCIICLKFTCALKRKTDLRGDKR